MYLNLERAVISVILGRPIYTLHRLAIQMHTALLKIVNIPPSQKIRIQIIFRKSASNWFRYGTEAIGAQSGSTLLFFISCLWLQLYGQYKSAFTRGLALRHSQNTSAHRMDHLLGARMDGSVPLVTSLDRVRYRARARVRLGLGIELELGLRVERGLY